MDPKGSKFSRQGGLMPTLRDYRDGNVPMWKPVPENDKTATAVGTTKPDPLLGWFPLRPDLVQSVTLKQLSPLHKVILADLIHRVSQHQGLYAKGYRTSAHFVEGDANELRPVLGPARE